MNLRFWGTRGSIPVPGSHTTVYGGDTTCLELRYSDDAAPIIIDAGSGIRSLGNQLIAQMTPDEPLRADILMTHTHWDHILGLPFFSPIFIPGTEIDVYGPVLKEGDSLEHILSEQLQYRYFPVRHDEIEANVRYRALHQETIDKGDGMIIKTTYLNHPVLCLGYRFEHNGRVLCTLFDTEPFVNLFADGDPEDERAKQLRDAGDEAAREQNERLLDFAAGADVLIHDAQYTQKEYLDRYRGWGHSSYEHVVNFAARAGVKRVYFFHHDPQRTDTQLDRLLAHYRGFIRERAVVELHMARQGETIEI